MLLEGMFRKGKKSKMILHAVCGCMKNSEFIATLNVDNICYLWVQGTDWSSLQITNPLKVTKCIEIKAA